ncbi:amidohydrolase family protein [Frigoribacterium faeni]|uniref:Cytosine deaminase n=1 Tax=Frigoribacterium faeni TaxID=145483 RepID=A0A7W3JIV0_9MICO|nr:amidohydrolase family protein [Frigoribacterium faeni]MBA8813669.1 cytosine deaminase [Frigoribacterium faeni]GEK83314.1 cytosine deaminase [Frigoribacterium faeni]
MTRLPRQLSLLRNAALPDGSTVDVRIEGDTVAAVLPAGTAPAAPGSETLDLAGHVLLTAPAEPHAHLDKALSWDAIRPPMGDLELAIASWRVYAATMTVDDIADRARRQLLAMLAQGTTAVRTHVDVLLGGDATRGAEALVRVRDELRDLIDVEIVALASQDSPDSDVEAVLDLGVDLIGGAPHLSRDPQGDLHRLLDLAERRGVGVDLHTDESLDGAVTLDAFARRVVDWTTTVSAGHCSRLGSMPVEQRDEVIAAVRAADIGIIANPITNLYLQGWDRPVSTPRGLTALRPLLDAGVRLAAGADNVRDPFNPLGRSDALETAMLLVTAGHLTIDEAYAAVSDSARSVMGLPQAGAVVGARAEFLAIRASSLADVVASASPDRFAVHAGRLVAASRVTREVADPAPTAAEHALTLTETR